MFILTYCFLFQLNILDFNLYHLINQLIEFTIKSNFFAFFLNDLDKKLF